MYSLVLSAVCSYLLWCFCRFYHPFITDSSKRLPPPHPHKSLRDLSRTYGPIIKLSLGKITTVIVSSPSTVKDVLQTHDVNFSSNRVVPDLLTAYNHHEFGASLMPFSPPFKTVRRICNVHIFAAKKLDGNRHLRSEQVRRLVRSFRERARDGQAINVGKAAFRTTLNLLSNTTFSVDLANSGNTSRVGELKEVIANITADAGRPNLVDFFPVLKRWDPKGLRMRMEANMRRIFDIFDGMIEQRSYTSYILLET